MCDLCSSEGSPLFVRVESRLFRSGLHIAGTPPRYPDGHQELDLRRSHLQVRQHRLDQVITPPPPLLKRFGAGRGC